MRKEYYENLVKKLERAYRYCNLELEHETAIILNKRELEDLHFLWKSESPKIWKIDEDVNVLVGEK